MQVRDHFCGGRVLAPGEKPPPGTRWCNPCAYLYASYVVRVYTLDKEGR